MGKNGRTREKEKERGAITLLENCIFLKNHITPHERKLRDFGNPVTEVLSLAGNFLTLSQKKRTEKSHEGSRKSGTAELTFLRANRVADATG